MSSFQLEDLKDYLAEELIRVNERSSEQKEEMGYTTDALTRTEIQRAIEKCTTYTLSSLQKSFAIGANPVAVGHHNGALCILETFRTCPLERLNLAYNDYTLRDSPKGAFNGSVEHQTREYGLLLADREIVNRYLKPLPDREGDCFDYIRANDSDFEQWNPPFLARQSGRMDIFNGKITTPFSRRGWRGMLLL